MATNLFKFYVTIIKGVYNALQALSVFTVNCCEVRFEKELEINLK